MRKQFGAYVGCYSLDINHTWFIALGRIAVLLLYVLYSVRVIPLLIFDGQTVTANGLFF